MSHMCGTTCKRKQTPPVPCATCGLNGGSRRPHATPQQIGAAVDMYFDGLSYKRVAENIEEYFGRKTNAVTIMRWVHDYADRAHEIVHDTKTPTGPEWVADEIVVRVGGRKYWLFNVMDAKTRFVLAAHLSPQRTARAAATALALTRDRAADPPNVVKTDGLPSYGRGVRTAFPTHGVKHVVSQGIRAVINNNLSEGCRARSETGTRRCAAFRLRTRARPTSTALCCTTTTSGRTAESATSRPPAPPALISRSTTGRTSPACRRPQRERVTGLTIT